MLELAPVARGGKDAGFRNLPREGPQLCNVISWVFMPNPQVPKKGRSENVSALYGNVRGPWSAAIASAAVASNRFARLSPSFDGHCSGGGSAQTNTKLDNKVRFVFGKLILRIKVRRKWKVFHSYVRIFSTILFP